MRRRLTDKQGMDDALDALFLADGHWREPPPAWQHPERALKQSQFFETLQVCVDLLPAKLSRNVDEQMQFIRRAMKKFGSDAKRPPQ